MPEIQSSSDRLRTIDGAVSCPDINDIPRKQLAAIERRIAALECRRARWLGTPTEGIVPLLEQTDSAVRFRSSNLHSRRLEWARRSPFPTIERVPRHTSRSIRMAAELFTAPRIRAYELLLSNVQCAIDSAPRLCR
ncbi:hypothetical protein QZM22_12655 [Burkholderia oklahomensis]|uniref:hypothetical protein n=1 Tax=Burkholderia oklahomensis TaxID=342113 RepID=UPI00264DA54C|nr:hypothetical protein [Burkholderia oklahomensis]MDN7673348.1 hypothetical protein [Burkholderia oklahomensis]